MSPDELVRLTRVWRPGDRCVAIMDIVYGHADLEIQAGHKGTVEAIKVVPYVRWDGIEGAVAKALPPGVVRVTHHMPPGVVRVTHHIIATGPEALDHLCACGEATLEVSAEGLCRTCAEWFVDGPWTPRAAPKVLESPATDRTFYKPDKARRELPAVGMCVLQEGGPFGAIDVAHLELASLRAWLEARGEVVAFRVVAFLLGHNDQAIEEACAMGPAERGFTERGALVGKAALAAELMDRVRRGQDAADRVVLRSSKAVEALVADFVLPVRGAGAEPPDPAKRVPTLAETLATLRDMHGTIVRHYFHDDVTASQQSNLSRAARVLAVAAGLLEAVHVDREREAGR